jgi:hypothetical protein
MGKPLLEYATSAPEYPQSIVSAKTLVPKWFKEIPKFKGGTLNRDMGKTLKQCVPFGDSFTTGYLLTTSYDLYVDYKDGLDKPFITWVDIKQGHPPVSVRDNSSSDGMPVPLGYDETHYIWHLPVCFRVPVGYSALLTHPLNRYDLPFYTLSGVFDGGYTFAPHSNIPFFLKQGFEGIIPQGTPFAQLIPFKQDSWTARQNPEVAIDGELNRKKSHLVISGWYKKTFWKKKQYD